MIVMKICENSKYWNEDFQQYEYFIICIYNDHLISRVLIFIPIL